MQSGKEPKDKGGKKKMSDYGKHWSEKPVPVQQFFNRSSMLVTMKKIKRRKCVQN